MYSSAQLLTFCFSVTSSIWKAADVARHVFIHWSSFRMFKWMYSHSLQKVASSKEFIIGLYFMTPCLTVADSPTCVLCLFMLICCSPQFCRLKDFFQACLKDLSANQKTPVMSSFTNTSARPSMLMTVATEGAWIELVYSNISYWKLFFIHSVSHSHLSLPLADSHSSLYIWIHWSCHWTTTFPIDPTIPFLTVIVDNHPRQACFRPAGTLLWYTLCEINQLTTAAVPVYTGTVAVVSWLKCHSHQQGPTRAMIRSINMQDVK